MSEQNENTTETTIDAEGVETPNYGPEQFEQVRRARHAVRRSLGKFQSLVGLVSVRDEGIANALRATRKGYSAMSGKPGYSQDEQVRRFGWAIEDIDAAVEALGAVETEDEFDTKALALAVDFLNTRVRAEVEEGKSVAADRDFEAYKAAKDAHRNRQWGYTPHVFPDVDFDDSDRDEDDDEV